MGSRLGCAIACALALTSAASAAPRATGAGTIVFAADHAPTLAGEVFRVDPDGKRTDLSKSFAKDGSPSVSPDGRWVAFASNRNASAAVYVVGSDGRGLRRVSPVLYHAANAQNVGAYAQIAWSGDSTRIAAAVSGFGAAAALWEGDLSGHGRVVTRRPGIQTPSWSPSGELAYVDVSAGQAVVVDASGRRLWAVDVIGMVTASWSHDGRLAVGPSHGTIAVYDARGRRLWAFHGYRFAWSPDGRRLASVADRRLQVRVGGAGKPVVNAAVGAAYGVQWIGSTRARVDDGDGWRGYDVAHDRPWTLSPAYAAFAYPSVVSPSGVLASATRLASPTSYATLTVGGKAVARAFVCSDDTPFASLQFVPGTRSVVYSGGCPVPSADVYSVAADGSGLRHVTATPTDETSPSAGASTVAFVHMLVAEKCDGCPTTIWTAGLDGTNVTRLTPDTQDIFDSSPSLSPDGSTIVFERQPIDGPSHLVEIPAAGGAEKVLPIVGGHAPSWGPARIAYTTGSGVVRTALPDGSAVQTVTTDSQIVPQTLVWSRDGRLAWVDQSGRGALTIVVGARRIALPRLYAAFRGIGLAWSPDGTRLAVTADDAGGVGDVWVVGADGTHLTRLTHGLGAGGRLSWLP